MSFSARLASSFFGPLRGKTSSFVVGGREANILLAEVAISLATLTGDGCAVLDLDALYSSNSDRIFGGLPAAVARSTTIHVPEPDSSVEMELSKLFATTAKVLVIDSLNSLHHLLSSDDARSRSRKLAFAVASLSYLARTDRRAVLFTMYKRERPLRTAARSIADLADLKISVKADESGVSMECERRSIWPGGRFSVPLRVP
ncbi:MAG: hypothetical protein OK438_05385 [Thaumarchaeota archaeon]|nr:hypothetical protein [Nitrososphaerota archaeon]